MGTTWLEVKYCGREREAGVEGRGEQVQHNDFHGEESVSPILQIIKAIRGQFGNIDLVN